MKLSFIVPVGCLALTASAQTTPQNSGAIGAATTSSPAAKPALSSNHPRAAASSLDRIGDELVVMTREG